MLSYGYDPNSNVITHTVFYEHNNLKWLILKGGMIKHTNLCHNLHSPLLPGKVLAHGKHQPQHIFQQTEKQISRRNSPLLLQQQLWLTKFFLLQADH